MLRPEDEPPLSGVQRQIRRREIGVFLHEYLLPAAKDDIPIDADSVAEMLNRYKNASGQSVLPFDMVNVEGRLLKILLKERLKDRLGLSPDPEASNYRKIWRSFRSMDLDSFDTSESDRN